MKKLCVVTTTSITIKSFLINQLSYLSHHGYVVTVVCDYDADLAKILPKNINYNPISMNRGVEGIGMIKSIWNLYRFFKSKKFDIVQYSTPNAAFYSSVSAWGAKIPIRLYCQWGIRYVGYTGWKRKLFKIVEKLTCKLSTNIQPDSYGNLQFGREEGLYSASKGEVIWNGSANGVDLNTFDVQKKDQWRLHIRELYKIEEKDFVFGFIGRLNKDKGVNELLHSFKNVYQKYPHAKLLIVGPDEGIETINPQIYRWSTQCKGVIYCGYKTDIEKYYAAMDAFVLPSYREGFGSVVIEAGIMGVPAIVTNIPGPTNAMKPNVTGFVVPKASVNPLQTSMEKILLDRDLCRQMGLNAYLFTRDHFEQKTLWKHILANRNELTNREMSIKHVQGQS
ncbi:glycosyltransferase family 4 protein [Bacillus niameyensis]|uniref:glycosyltransferase family 4 protein n=1 Tax=Bacillus niameyensis TaxID=1522308 RepID=UPI000782D802|nr:glycosyltransferase family 4 protein [Bacillus niameyensis]